MLSSAVAHIFGEVMPKHIVYQPPSRKVISAYAQLVCDRLAEQYGASYATPEVVSGFTEFLLVVAVMLAKRLNASCERENKVADTTD